MFRLTTPVPVSASFIEERNYDDFHLPKQCYEKLPGPDSTVVVFKRSRLSLGSSDVGFSRLGFCCSALSAM